MKYLDVRFLCRMESSGSFSSYKGSMLRGALGASLRRAVCMTQKTECNRCMLQRTCVFPRLFTAATAPEDGGTSPMLPPPFCLEPDLTGQCDYEAGERFSFGLKLFSYATDYLPYFIHAFSMAGKRGMGRGTEYGHGRFRIEDVLREGHSIYDAQTEQLHCDAPGEIEMPEPCPSDREGVLDVHLLTPLRFKENNRLTDRLEFSHLLLLITRRIRSLCALDGRAFRLPEEAFGELLRGAEAVQVEENNLRWQDWSRWSGKQGAVMKLGGLVGHIRYRGPVARFREYVDFACRVHIGKQTSFGLGAAAWSGEGL